VEVPLLFSACLLKLGRKGRGVGDAEVIQFRPHGQHVNLSVLAKTRRTTGGLTHSSSSLADLRQRRKIDSLLKRRLNLVFGALVDGNSSGNWSISARSVRGCVLRISDHRDPW